LIELGGRGFAVDQAEFGRGVLVHRQPFLSCG
jgi:hypothetical protein